MDTSQIGSKERKSRFLYAKSMFEPVEENAVIDGIKCSAMIKESEKRHLTIITGSEEVVQDSKCRSFSAGSDEHGKLTEVEAKVSLCSDGQVTET